MIWFIAGKVVKAFGFGTAEIGVLSAKGVPARLNCVTPAPGNWSVAVQLLNRPMLFERSPFLDGSMPSAPVAKNQSLEKPYMVAIASLSPLET